MGVRFGREPLPIDLFQQANLYPLRCRAFVREKRGTGYESYIGVPLLDEAGEGMTVTHACEFAKGAKARLLSELSLKAPLRIDAQDEKEKAFYQKCGFKRWFAADNGQHIGLSARHPAKSLEALSPTLALDEALILRRFKHDAAAFAQAKEAFLTGINNVPATL